MNPLARGAQHYLQTQVRSSSPLELVVMLYDGALASCTAATEALARRDIPARRAALSKAMAIVGQLQGTLDMTGGGVGATELDELYTWITGRFVEAAVRQDPAPLQEARRVLEILRDGWHQIAKQPVPESAA
jgi:flagellar secretion chaperone FliS